MERTSPEPTWSLSRACLLKLNLYDTQVAASAVVGVVARLTSLVSLSLAMNKQIEDAVVCALDRLVQLRDLSLMNTKITDKSIDSLMSMPQLTRLDLSMTRLRCPRLDMLQKLKTLDLSFSHVECLRLPWGLEHLDLRRAQGEFSALWVCLSLKTLDIANSEVNWERLVAPSLAEIVVSHKDRERAARCFRLAAILEII